PTLPQPRPAPPAPAPPAQVTPAPPMIEHTVQRRDTLWDLAERYLGDGYRAREVFELNRGRPQPDGGTLSDPGVIRPGWIIHMPADAAPQEPAPSVTVRPGDTLWEIAADQLHDGRRFVDIVELNKGRTQPDGRTLADPQLIEPGWVLELPADEAGSAAAPVPAPARPEPTPTAVAPPTTEAPQASPAPAPRSAGAPDGL